MAVKLILTQIMKDESHVAKRMLDSIKNIVDGICVVDTGSTDDSIEIVKNWGKENNVETYVIERPFDNFENSRNCSFEKAREKFAELSEQEGRSPTDYAMEVPCFPGINLISKSKSKDMNIVLHLPNLRTSRENCRPIPEST